MIGGSFRPRNVEYFCGTETDDLAGMPGGQGFWMQAAAALNVGDGVYLSGQAATAYTFLNTQPGYGTVQPFAPQVNKSATLANYTASAFGIVIGGFDTDTSVGAIGLIKNSVVVAPGAIGIPAASAAGQLVFVLTDGICWATVDGAVAVGAKLTASAGTAGQLSTTGAVAGNIIAKALNSTAGAGATLVFVQLA